MNRGVHRGFGGGLPIQQNPLTIYGGTNSTIEINWSESNYIRYVLPSSSILPVNKLNFVQPISGPSFLVLFLDNLSGSSPSGTINYNTYGGIGSQIYFNYPPDALQPSTAACLTFYYDGKNYFYVTGSFTDGNFFGGQTINFGAGGKDFYIVFGNGDPTIKYDYTNDALRFSSNGGSGIYVDDILTVSQFVSGLYFLANDVVPPPISSGQAVFSGNSSNGASIKGNGSLSDFSVVGQAGFILTVPSDTQNLQVSGAVQSTGFGTLIDPTGVATTSRNISWNSSSLATCTLTAATNCTFTFTDPTYPGTYVTLEITQASTPTGTFTLPASVIVSPGQIKQAPSNSSWVTVLIMYWDGTNYYLTDSYYKNGPSNSDYLYAANIIDVGGSNIGKAGNGSYIGWNYTSGSAEMDFINQSTSAVGGFNWYKSDGTTISQVMQLTPSGLISFNSSPYAWKSGTNYAGMEAGVASLFLNGNNPYLNCNVYLDNTSTWKYQLSTSAAQLAVSTSSLLFNAASAGTAGTTATMATKFSVDSSGNASFAGKLGIGTSSPGAGTALVVQETDTTFTQIQIWDSTATGKMTLGADGAAAGYNFMGSYSNHPLVFRVNNTEVARLSTSANLTVTNDINSATYSNKTQAIGTVTTTASLNFQTGGVSTLTLTSATNCTISVGTAPTNSNTEVRVIITNPATGTIPVVTFPSTFIFDYGIPVQPSTVLGAATVYELFYDGTNYYVSSVKTNKGKAVLSLPVSTASNLTTSEVYKTNRFYIPANSLQVGTSGRFVIAAAKTGTSANATFRLKFGTAGTTADANLFSYTTTTETSAGNAYIHILWTVVSTGSSGSIFVQYFSAGSPNNSFDAIQNQVNPYTATINTTNNNYIGISALCSVNSVFSINSIIPEMCC